MKLLAAVLLVPATFLWQLAGSPESPAPRQDGGVIFSHQFHVEDVEAACEDCHEAAAESMSGLDNLLPDHDVCGVCHEVDDFDECATCHEDGDDPEGLIYIEDYSSKFPHATHLAGGLECAACHEAIAAADEDTQTELPGMVQCVDCHETNVVSVECLTCHTPDEDLVPSTHVVGFSRAHGDLAQGGAISAHGDLTCQTCHDDVFCQDCHEGDNLDRLSHPLNWEFSHALAAQAATANCASCHADPIFCNDCHNDSGIMPHTHRPGWVNSADGGLHRIEAANDLNTCISCHEDNAEFVCQPCHGS